MRTQMAIALLSLSVVSSLLFGGLVHAMAPHDHENETMWSALHAAVRHENNSAGVIVSPSVAFLIAAALVAARFVTQAAPLGKFESAIRRGVVAYRRFG